MSTWTNEFDVFRDLDRLSGFGRSNVTYPALNAFGRGKLIVKEDEHGRITQVAQFSPPPPKIAVPHTYAEVGVASNTQYDTTWERDRDLYLQLRQVCGRGYSNELIEEEFGQTDRHSQERLNDISSHPIVEDLLVEESNKLIISDPEHTSSTLNESVFPQLTATDTKLVLPDVKHSQARLFVHPPKLKPSRNALLNSLARRKILQLSEEPEMNALPTTFCESGTVCIAEDVISNGESLLDTKLLGTELVNEQMHSATDNELPTTNMDSQKIYVDTMEICDQTQSCGEVQKKCINWSDIRKLKATGYNPVSKYSDGSSSPAVRAVNSYSSQMFRQDSKVKPMAATSISDLPGFSASPNSLYEEKENSDCKQGDYKEQDLSHRALSELPKSKAKRTREYRSSLPSSPTNSVTPNEKVSWSSLRKHSSHPKNIMLSDFIEPICNLGSGQNFSQVSSPHQEELNNSLQIHSVKDFPPL